MIGTSGNARKATRTRARWRAFDRFDIASVFESYPKDARLKLMRLRQLIFDTAEATEGVGELEEALRWGQPSYLTSKWKSGSIIRIDRKNDTECSMYFHCQTDLVDRFRELYPNELTYEGSRAITFRNKAALPEKRLEECIAMALTYHLDKRKRTSTRQAQSRKK